MIKSNFCIKCGAALTEGDTFCGNCGAEVPKENRAVKVMPYMFDQVFNLSEEALSGEFVRREMEKAQIDSKSNLKPEAVVKRKTVLSAIFSLLLMIYVGAIFFHVRFWVYALGALILLIFFIRLCKFDIHKYMMKKIKERPGEKISNIVMSEKASMVPDRKLLRLAMMVAAIAIPLAVFSTPKTVYEKAESGYGYYVRFYTLGLTGNDVAVIPDTYKDEPVVGIRGNVFAEMKSLQQVTLPDSIVEIRGQCFENDENLMSINIPANLEYLGGSAFAGCSSLMEVYLPDTLTEMGGECFSGAFSLTTVRLSQSLTEIRGNTFENCYSLESIEIPDGVTRIGGHAFYGCYSLENVFVSENSKLVEIGSSAFRMCSRLYEIKLPMGVDINEKAFKESPTVITYYGMESYE